VPEQPTNLQGEAISATSIQLTWDEPRGRDGATPGVAVDSYELYYNDSHLRQNVRVTISPPVNSYRLDDLTPDTVYHIRVSARSAARGESASTPTIQVRTPEYGLYSFRQVRKAVRRQNATAKCFESADCSGVDLS